MLKSPYKHPPIYPDGEHPRLMLRQKDIARVRENLTHPENKRAYKMWQRVLKTKLLYMSGDTIFKQVDGIK